MGGFIEVFIVVGFDVGGDVCVDGYDLLYIF